MLRLLAAVGLVAASELRRDGAAVTFPPAGHLYAEFAALSKSAYPFKPFSPSFVKKALSTPTNWTARGAVTPAKDQGPHGYCGTFGRVGAAEGQYALRSGLPLASFSEEELVDCVGWDREQFPYFAANGFMSSKDYPYNLSAYPDQDPPIPGNPCRFSKSKAIAGTGGGKFTDSTGGGPDEDQLAAFVYKNGPLQTGINANVFGLREHGCEATGTCFITQEMCSKVTKVIDHSILLVGYGTDPVQGDYWIVKNSCACEVVARPCPAPLLPPLSLSHCKCRPSTPPHAPPRVHCLCQPRVYQRCAGRELRGYSVLRERLYVWRPFRVLQ